MNKKFKITIEELGAEFTTDSPFKAFAFLTAVEHHDIDSNLAQEVAELCYDVYVGENTRVNGVDVIDYICENYEELPDDFNEISNVVINAILSYDL